MRQARKAQNELPDVLPHNTGVGELETGDSDAFLIDILCFRTPARKIHAADVDLMGAKTGPGNKATHVKQRLQYLDVVLMHGGPIRVAAEKHVARAQALLRKNL